MRAWVMAGISAMVLSACVTTPPPRVVDAPWDHRAVPLADGSKLVAGPEDVATDGQGWVWVSHADRAAALDLTPNDRVETRGGIALLNARAPAPTLTDVTPAGIDRDNFQPHGIDRWGTGDGQRLFIIDHPKTPCGVSKVWVAPILKDGRLGTARVLATDGPADNGMPNPNDLVAVGASAFYVSNVSGAGDCRDPLSKAVGDPPGFVSYFDGVAFHRLGGAPSMPNGVAVTPTTGKPTRLFVSSTLVGVIAVYDISADPAPKAPMGMIAVGGMLDNMTALADGTLLVASHRSLPRFLLDSALSVPAWSTLFHVDPVSGRVAKVFDNGGGLVSAASSVVVDQRQGLPTRAVIGSVYQEGPAVIEFTDPVAGGPPPPPGDHESTRGGRNDLPAGLTPHRRTAAADRPTPPTR